MVEGEELQPAVISECHVLSRSLVKSLEFSPAV
jgi:hypothetical protein